ncbi:MAG: anhydro-N-acetylmuramic acid kinase [Acidobacteria bacterium]|nr:anhydro-N-acetylmuramic acid kinase [Acidobacteriota bacterium]
MIKDLIAEIRNKDEKLVIGLMAGTSVDGIDAALIRLYGHGKETRFELVKFTTLEFSESIRNFILKNSNPDTAKLDDICRLNFLLGEAFASAALDVTKKADIDIAEVDLIGSHGQTIQHLPEAQKLYGFNVASTLQVGEPSIIAHRTGVLTVADFRPKDIAAGGQGAPFIPYVDYILLHSPNECRVCLNIGGIANLTFLTPDSQNTDIIAFDTGPGNMLIDLLMSRLSGERYRYDAGGETALSGTVDPKLLDRMMEHPYLETDPPKSTGRESFGSEYADWIIEISRNIEWKNIIATVTRFTVESIALSVEKHLEPNHPVDRIIISGGGSHNKAIISGLEERLPLIHIEKSDEMGIPVDAKEAIGFAILANETIHYSPSNLPTATGARKKVILGKIVLPG